MNSSYFETISDNDLAQTTGGNLGLAISIVMLAIYIYNNADDFVAGWNSVPSYGG